MDEEIISICNGPWELVSYPLHSYNPYERIGKWVVQEVYVKCKYLIDYGSTASQDRLTVVLKG